MSRTLELQPRLQALADWVRPGSRIADVGTDHGYLPVWLRQNGVVDYAIASDINEEPLLHARRSAEKYAQTGIDFRLCPGLDAIRPEEIDTVIVAGMGGENIAAILADAPWTAAGKHCLLLQPMSRDADLRRWLMDAGYRVLRERLVLDKGVIYPILEVTGGSMEQVREGALYGGFRLQKDPLEGEYLAQRIAKLRRAAEGLRRSRDPADGQRAGELEAILRDLEIMREEWSHANRKGD